MPQQQCPWCGHCCGPRYPEGASERPAAHSDGSSCVCRHVSCEAAAGAFDNGGRFFSRPLNRWVCLGGCEPRRTDDELLALGVRPDQLDHT